MVHQMILQESHSSNWFVEERKNIRLGTEILDNFPKGQGYNHLITGVKTINLQLPFKVQIDASNKALGGLLV